jgi:hypothetical protein
MYGDMQDVIESPKAFDKQTSSDFHQHLMNSASTEILLGSKIQTASQDLIMTNPYGLGSTDWAGTVYEGKYKFGIDEPKNYRPGCQEKPGVAPEKIQGGIDRGKCPDRFPDMFPDKYPPKDSVPDSGNPRGTAGGDNPQFYRMKPRIKENEERSPKTLDPKINPRLGCAVAISDVLNSADPRIKKTDNIRDLERSMREAGYERVPADQIRPGDVIVGRRPDGRAGHVAIYVGDGKVFNNNSDSGTMRTESADKFNARVTNKDGSYNPKGYSEIVVYRPVQRPAYTAKA